MELWKPIDNFLGYSISDYGRIRNDRTNRIIVMTRNQHGTLQVGLMRNKVQYKRSVPLLVAQAFLPEPQLPAFDTPINLDGNRLNNRADNLVWRPRWFAVKYHLQFERPREGFKTPIIEVKTGEIFPTSWEVAVKFGLLDREIVTATLNRTYVWPTYQFFQVIEN